MPQIKISQLQSIVAPSDADFVEVSQCTGQNSYTSSKASMEQVAQYVSDYQGFQFGGISGSWFQGNPLAYQVSLKRIYPNSNYVVTVTGEDPRLWTILSKTTASFVVSSNSSVPFYGYVYWRTDQN